MKTVNIVKQAEQWSTARGYTGWYSDKPNPDWVLSKESLYQIEVRKRREENYEMARERQSEYAKTMASERKMEATKALQLLQQL